MRRFLIQIFWFSVIVLICLGIGEIVVRRMPNSYSTKNAALERNDDKINTIILGSSHSYYGLRPEILGDSVLSLANISQTPEYDLALLEKWLPKMPNVKRVIISISYFTFVESRMEDFDHGTLAVNYKVYMHLDLHSDFSKYNFILTDRKSVV